MVCEIVVPQPGMEPTSLKAWSLNQWTNHQEVPPLYFLDNLMARYTCNPHVQFQIPLQGTTWWKQSPNHRNRKHLFCKNLIRFNHGRQPFYICWFLGSWLSGHERATRVRTHTIPEGQYTQLAKCCLLPGAVTESLMPVPLSISQLLSGDKFKIKPLNPMVVRVVLPHFFLCKWVPY